MASMHEIDYKIFGDDMQFVEVELDPMEAAVAEASGMMYMEDGIEMETIFGDGSQQRTGFLNAYSETYPHEERAELFASLLLEPAVVATHLKRTNDPVLRDKVRYVIEKCERLLGLRLAY